MLVCLWMTSGTVGGFNFQRDLCHEGASYPVITSNDAEEVLVAWEQTEGEVRDGSCEHAVARASIESPNGVVSLGALPTGGKLALPVGSYIDEAGEAWIAGLYGEVGAEKDGPTYGEVGAWLSFRPPGGHFENAISLPSRHGNVDSVLLDGNHKGQLLLVWGAPHGTYLGLWPVWE
jgi:hypothetical protein